MKKIHITQFHRKDKTSVYTRDRKYSIYLGNRVCVYFTDMKKAKAFITATNKFLNQKLYELNALYIDTFVEYRTSWFYFFSLTDSEARHIATSKVFSELQIVETKMSQMVSRSAFVNGSSIVWHGFDIAIESLLSVTSAITDLYKQKKHYNQSHNVRVIHQRIQTLKEQINTWGKDQGEVTEYS